MWHPRTTRRTSGTPPRLLYDVVQRRLRDLGHETRCVRNITDVDDPLLTRAKLLGVHYLDLAAGEVARFDSDMEALDMLPSWSEPRATSAIPDIRGFIAMVLERGHAYQAGGAVYFDIKTFPTFGEISHYTEEEMVALARERGGNVDDPNKRSPLDFGLWQRRGEGEPFWGRCGGRAGGLAHRVFGSRAARTRYHHRPPRRRSRLDLPPPRVRTSPK